MKINNEVPKRRNCDGRRIFWEEKSQMRSLNCFSDRIEIANAIFSFSDVSPERKKKSVISQCLL